ncbi:MAG: peptide/nickel transport system substrate-binding protein [Solirubrobacteraceae bacterium]|jgi:peptide/nickel transport system substrate-binding protein|nr:peptide/nickel transport system substrate-binding protein [Solirubrobacteraceae bacterium]
MRWRSIAALMGVVAATCAVAACGSSSNNSSKSKAGAGSSGAASSGAVEPGKAGGKLTMLAAGDIDYLDPGQDYYTFGYEVQYAVNRTLYSYKPQDSEHPVPDLATGPPEISPDNKTITVHIRTGVKYAPPVNRVVTSKDIKYAFERAFSKYVPSGYAGTYFSSIAGSPTAGTGPIKPISGIETPDDQTIIFHLKTPSAPLVSQALVMPITTPVPQEYAAKFDKKLPSTYDQYAAFIGPYMVKNDPKTGKVVGRVPGKSIDIVRNPNWDKSTDYRPAYLDEIFIQEGNNDLASAARRALSGSATICCDSSQPPAQVLKQALQREPKQVVFIPAGGTHYIALNTKVKPFDNIDIRKAIIAGSDRNALRLTAGGAIIGDIATGFIPPGIPGFDEAGGIKQDTDLDFFKSPAGDPAVAKKYMLAAKQQDPSLPIDANGRWTGGGKVLTIAANADPGRKTAEVFQNQMGKLGFQLNLREVPQDTLYTKFCGVPKANVAICPNVGWFKDFSDPQSMLDATFNGNNILQQGNVNWPQLDVKAINDAMTAAALKPVGPERSKAWAQVNHMIAEQAPAIPLTWDKTAVVQSKNVVGVANGYYAAHDFTYTSLK